MPDLFDIAVLGGGPAGRAAADIAIGAGALVTVLHEQGHDGCVVWGVGGGPLVPAGAATQPFRLDAVAGDRTFSVFARALVLCPGAHERSIPDAAEGQGRVPSTEAARLFKAAMVYAPDRGGWVPVLDDAQRSSVNLLYVAGDAAGIADAAAATVTGRIAALAALADLALLEPATATARMRSERHAISFDCAPDVAALVRAIPPDCVVCPCETLTRRDIDAAIAAGARDVNQIKQFTRCGMGPCQGRICGEAVAELVALWVGGRAAAGQFTARIPLRPVPMATLLGAFDYADIPVPAPAPI